MNSRSSKMAKFFDRGAASFWVICSLWVTGAQGIRDLGLNASSAGAGLGSSNLAYSDSRLVPALVVFGDSTVDAGNNNYLVTIIKSDFRPYGMNFQGQVPTGRFTDGLLVTDYISQKIGIPLQLPYLHPQAHGEAILTGVNFASSASGWYDNTATHFNVKGLTTQFEWYHKWRAEVESVAGPEKANYIFANALYAFSTGTNDWVNNYYLNPELQQKYTTDKYTDLLIDNIRKYTLELYSLGGRNMAILSIPPLGCIPSQITLHGHGNKTCVKRLNDVALIQNDKIKSLIAEMNTITPGARLIYIDIFSPIYNAFQEPEKYGFKYARDGCCGTGDLEVAVLCNRALVSACSNPSEHIFWDSFHPTSHFYSQLAEYMYSLAKPVLLAPGNH